MPLLYTATYMLNDGNANKVVICHLIVSFALLIKQLAAKGKRTTFLVITFGTLFYVMYTSWIIYPQYIMHSYFYTYLFAIVLFVLFSDEELREEFYLYFINAKKKILFVFCITYNIDCLYNNKWQWIEKNYFDACFVWTIYNPALSVIYFACCLLWCLFAI